MADPSPYVWRIIDEEIVGTAKYLGGDPSSAHRRLHGRPLSEYAREGEELVVIYHVQIFAEFGDVHYPYCYHDFDGPPDKLADLNVKGKHFQSMIAWDKNKLTPNSSGKDLGGEPREVYAGSLRFGRRLEDEETRNIKRVRLESGNVPDTRDEGHLCHGGSSYNCRLSSGKGLAQGLREPTFVGRCQSDDSNPTVPMERSVYSGQRAIADSTVLAMEVQAGQDVVWPSSELREVIANDSCESSEESSDEFSGSTVQEEECRPVLPLLKRRGKRRYTYRTRRRKNPEEEGISILRARRLELSARLDNPFLARRACCRKKCFESTQPIPAFKDYKDYIGAARRERKRFLIRLYDRSAHQFCYQNRAVCTVFLEKAFGFSRDIQRAVKHTEGCSTSPTANNLPRDVRRETKSDVIVNYLRQHDRETGDMMPHTPHTNLAEVRKNQVYEKFSEYFRERFPDDSAPKKSYFYHTWKLECSDIKTRRSHSFTVCSRCEILRSRLAQTREEDEERKIIEGELEAHISFMRNERRDYRFRCERAIQNPKKYCSIILDGADQKSYGLPHFLRVTKSDKGHKLKVKCVGVLEHRRVNKLSLYPVTEEFETGANHVIEATHRTLQRRKEEFGRLPEVLYVQADNCVRENKNRYFMGYFEMLVARGVFVEVEVSFLPIGHTHTDVDQAFSTVSNHLKILNVLTMTKLLAELRKCYGQRVHAEQLSKVANFSGLCDTSHCLNKIKGFTKYRYFRFTRKEDSLAVDGFYETACHVKIQGSDDWFPLGSSRTSNTFLASLPDLASVPPTATTPPDDVHEINLCLRSIEEREEVSESDLRELRAIRDVVYRTRTEPFHWNLESCFEMHGDHLPGSDVTAWNEDANSSMTNSGGRFQYDPSSFVAIKPGEGESLFWVAKIIQVQSRDSRNRPTWLRIRWFTAKGRGDDEFGARYELGTVFDRNLQKHVPYDDQVHVDSVLVAFSSLTRRGKLRDATSKAIRQVLNLN